ncbi:MAG TPA: hypothetical protein ENK86_03245 [Campylobacterales bacterium]|nr:hypothetical protein [Campylobacterales bacterium]
MLNTTNRLFLLIFSFGVLGCQSDAPSVEETQETIIVPPKSSVTKEDNSTEDSFFNRLGLSFENDKIIIDINKTSHFFESVEERVEEQVRQVDLNVTKSAGVIVNENEVRIDLNQTKKLLDDISGFFEEVMEDINRSIP